MARFHLWKPALAALFFIAVMLYLTGKQRAEGFQQPFDIQKMLAEFQRASGALGKQNAFGDWIGWLYAHPESSGAPLNDFKKRVFQPNCKFRRDWATVLPPGLNRPIPAGNKDLANVAYRTYMSCLADGNSDCIKQLEEARRRFMEPDCGFLNPRDVSTYTKDIQQVFS